MLILQNGAACLIDAGPKDARQNLVQDLRSYGVSQLDLLVMTHPHADHVGGIPGPFCRTLMCRPC